MKKWVILILVAVLVFSLVACSNPVEDGGEEATNEILYDENGNVLKEPVYYGWNLWYYHEYIYGAPNQIIKKRLCQADGSIVKEYKYVYREDGSLEKIEEYAGANGSTLTSEENYDTYGQRHKKQYFDINGSITDYYTYAYDRHGRCIKQCYYDALHNEFGSAYSTILYSYDENGNCVYAEKYDEYDELALYTTYTYDAKGYLIEEYKVQIRDDQYYTTITEYTNFDNGKVKDKLIEGDGVRTEETWDISGALTNEKHYEQKSSSEWFLRYTVKYYGDTVVRTDYTSNGNYKITTSKGNAAEISWSSAAYYNRNGSLFCTKSGNDYYDASGNKMSSAPNLSTWKD